MAVGRRSSTAGEVQLHRQLRESLKDAEGFSDLVVVIFLDVRGFSSFAGMAESSEAAIFLRRMYLEIIDNYFPDSAFFKPTGDGLMIIRHFDRDSLTIEVEWALATALSLVEAFPGISDQDPMVNFKVPTSLGIGIARGAATRLASGELTLDYSGRPLNLAARLMDLARPSGVVFDGQLIKGLDLSEDLLGHFISTPVFLKGIADRASMDVYSSTDVKVPVRNRRPLDGTPFETVRATAKLKDLETRHRFIHTLPVEPLDIDDIRLLVSHPVPTKSGAKGKLLKQRTFEAASTELRATGWQSIFDYDPIIKMLKADGVKSTWDCFIQVRYTISDTGAAVPKPPESLTGTP